MTLILEKLQVLAARTVERLRKRGTQILLETYTHGGRLGVGAPSWGAHENYLMGASPDRLADRLLPFLVARVHAGAEGCGDWKAFRDSFNIQRIDQNWLR
jgi:hypothetical protein